MTDLQQKFWTDYCKLHKEMKSIYIMAEEYSKDFKSILQPIKEQRDSLEHIVRAYGRILEKIDSDDDSGYDSYIEKNLSKAKDHLYRAYYDTADIFTIILREKIADYLSMFSYSEIISEWGKDEYNTERAFLIKVNQDIAELRINKDVIEGDDEKEAIFACYKDIITHLFAIYKYVLYELYPILAEKYN